MRINKCTFTASLAVAAFATGGAVVSNLYSRSSEKQSDTFKLKPVPDMQPPVYPSGSTYDLIHEGTFGAPRNIGEDNKWVHVARGTTSERTYKDPYSEKGGIILSKAAQHCFDRNKHKISNANNARAKFKLAIMCSEKVANEFRGLSPRHQNYLAHLHTANSLGLKKPSPYVSSSLNNATAAYFALGGIDHRNQVIAPNKNGRVYLAFVNNDTLVYPVLGSKVKGYNDQSIIAGQPNELYMDFHNDLAIPIGEIIIVGGYYYYDSITKEDAFKQDPETYKTLLDIKPDTLSTQMFTVPQNSYPSYLPFDNRYEAIKPYVCEIVPSCSSYTSSGNTQKSEL